MKAILVIDIPDDVAEAYEDFTIDYDLRGTPKDDQKVNESIKYVEDCPLKPMPKKKNTQLTEYNMIEVIYENGWNECLAEIESVKQCNLSTDEGWWKDYELSEMQND